MELFSIRIQRTFQLVSTAYQKRRKPKFPPLLFKNRNQTSLVAGECQRNNGERYNWINLLNIYDYE